MKKTIHFFLSTFILLTLLFGTQPASPAAASGPAPYLVKDINPYTALDDYFADNLTNVNGTLFFSANDGTNGWELWKSDGTFAGTVMVKDINPAGDSITANPNLTNVNGTLFFSANDGTNGKELWKSDGTAAGTVMVKDINPSGSSYPQAMFDNSGTLFFNASDDTHASELWKSDGTAAGTVMVKDINPTGDSSPSYLANVNGTLFFAANGTDGSELWKSDGTSGGTVLVKDINPGSADSFPNYLTNVNGTLFFQANDGTNGKELWKSDGTDAGTVMVKDINTSGNAYPGDLTNVNGTLFFTAEDDGNMDDLWKSDGTSSGTVKLLDIETGAASVSGMTNVNGTLFFSAYNSLSAAEGNELWRSDGTISGTQLVKDINPSGDSNPNYLTSVNGALFFSAADGSHGRELWRSDGTTAGTLMVADNNPGSGDGAYDNYIMPVNINNTLFFIGSDGVTGNELWAYTVLKSATFTDVPLIYWASSYIERLYNAGITGGCGTSPLIYCPDATVTRAQMAVFLLKSMHGSSFSPPAVGASTGFADVATNYWAAAWVKQLAAEGITGGCGVGVYCPDASVTRAQMAVFLLKAKHGSSYNPPNATGAFSDVPVGYWADKWIERLAAEGVTSGCGAGIYCPDNDVTRAQMAVFLVKAFNLP